MEGDDVELVCPSTDLHATNSGFGGNAWRAQSKNLTFVRIQISLAEIHRSVPPYEMERRN
jgi:hypothetical protein